MQLAVEALSGAYSQSGDCAHLLQSNPCLGHHIIASDRDQSGSLPGRGLQTAHKMSLSNLLDAGHLLQMALPAGQRRRFCALSQIHSQHQGAAEMAVDQLARDVAAQEIRPTEFTKRRFVLRVATRSF